MAKLELTIQTGNYESVRALRDRTVEPEGIRLNFADYPGVKEIHAQVASGSHDIGELNAGIYMANRSRGHEFTGLPVYLHRRFRHGFVFVNTTKGIASPQDLIGKRIGGTNFAPAANIWMRGILENDYGVPHESVTWVIERDEDGYFPYHPGLKVERIAPDQDLEQMLIDGEIDAMISPNVARGIEQGAPTVARLWPDYKSVEIEYYRTTGIFPIMHVTVLREEVVERAPWVVESLLDAFHRAKMVAYKRLENPRIVPLVWYQTALEEQRELLGPDPWSYGLDAINRKNLETMARYAHQQGLTEQLMPMAQLFPASAFGWQPRP
jgi:4,5-dihydroxyphthalate decarboxylase